MGYPFGTPGGNRTAAADMVGTPAAPASGEDMNWQKLDRGDPGASDPVARATDGGYPVEVKCATVGGATPAKWVSVGTGGGVTADNHVFKAAAGTLYYLGGFNKNASPRYLHVYDKATAPTVGTDVPKWTFLVPPNGTGAPLSAAIPPQGIAFAAGIAIGLTTGSGDTDSTAVAADDICVNVAYA